MPLLPSTQTNTANGVPLYVPLDGEGNVPNGLTVSGPIVANLGGGSRVIIEQTGDGPSLVLDNPNAPGLHLGITSLQNSGVLQIGTSGLPVSTTGPLTVPSIFGLDATSPVVPGVFGNAGANTWRYDPSGGQVTLVIAGYRLTVGTFATGGDGKGNVTFVTPFNAGGIPAIVCMPQTSGTGGGGVKGFICMGENNSGSTASPTNVGFQCIAVQANGEPLVTACCFFAFAPA